MTRLLPETWESFLQFWTAHGYARQFVAGGEIVLTLDSNRDRILDWRLVWRDTTGERNCRGEISLICTVERLGWGSW